MDTFFAAVKAGAWPQLRKFFAPFVVPPTFCEIAPLWKHLEALQIEMEWTPSNVINKMLTQMTGLTLLDISRNYSCSSHDEKHETPVAKGPTVVFPRLTQLRLGYADDDTLRNFAFPQLTDIYFSYRVWIDALDLAAMPMLQRLRLVYCKIVEPARPLPDKLALKELILHGRETMMSSATVLALAQRSKLNLIDCARDFKVNILPIKRKLEPLVVKITCAEHDRW